VDIHQNARTTPHSRAELVRRVVQEGQSPTAMAAAFGLCAKTVRKWVARFHAEGEAGLLDRSSRLHRCRSGCTATTGTGLMLASRPKPPSAASASPRTTC
jgi:transposase-like protein